jgi:NAD(P)-dependent dehydrogenase (short-subunit alcohol dehydrogenase family)
MHSDSVRAIVTGGVSGLGLAVAQRVVADGGRVALFDVNDDKGAAAVAALGEAKARYFHTDVTSEDGVAANVAAAEEFLGGLNVAVNCAGILGAGRVLGREAPMPLANFSTTVLVNLVGSFNVAKAAAARMQHNAPGDDGERGVIVNTASVAAYEGQIGQAAYSASKGGVVWTPMVDGMPDEVQASLSASIPFPSRLGRPEEFADLVAYIVGHRYLNGETIRLDGAVRLAPK